MPIAVICPGCKASFRVSDKFAGKTGNCPKCKAQIVVPNAAPEIKVHEAVSDTPKDSKGRIVTAPILRDVDKFNPKWAVAIGAGCLLTIAGAWFLGRVMLKPDAHGARNMLAAAGSLLVALPAVLAGYRIFREQEAEPLSGKSLWMRSGICSLIYAALWGVFYFVPDWWIPEYWAWFYIAPPFLLAGAVAAFACLDLDFGNGFFHYCFYLAVTIFLRYVIGMAPLWGAAAAVTNTPLPVPMPGMPGVGS